MSQPASRKIYVSGTRPDLRVPFPPDFAARLETSDAWIRERTGIVQRHIANESQGSSDLALHASRRALDAAGLAADQIDLIVVATSTPDYIFPSTACLLQAKLGVKGSAAFDVQAVCSGFVYGLSVADNFVKSGSAKRALVVGAEHRAHVRDHRRDLRALREPIGHEREERHGTRGKQVLQEVRGFPLGTRKASIAHVHDQPKRGTMRLVPLLDNHVEAVC